MYNTTKLNKNRRQQKTCLVSADQKRPPCSKRKNFIHLSNRLPIVNSLFFLKKGHITDKNYTANKLYILQRGQKVEDKSLTEECLQIKLVKMARNLPTHTFFFFFGKKSYF